MLASFMIIPAVFAFGLDPAAGPPLLFITLPEIFRVMPAGQFFGLLFFFSVSLAAISSLMPMVEIAVEGAANEDEARQVAYTIAHSPLVKTALFASDPNWGRILAAVGRAGLTGLEIAGVRIWLDDVCIVSDGGRDAGYTEAAGQAVMARDAFTIRIALGRGARQLRGFPSSGG